MDRQTSNSRVNWGSLLASPMRVARMSAESAYAPCHTNEAGKDLLDVLL